jgi:hypothetical protein
VVRQPGDERQKILEVVIPGSGVGQVSHPLFVEVDLNVSLQLQELRRPHGGLWEAKVAAGHGRVDRDAKLSLLRGGQELEELGGTRSLPEPEGPALTPGPLLHHRDASIAGMR